MSAGSDGPAAAPSPGPTVIIKGGTTSSRFDAEVSAWRASDARRRAVAESEAAEAQTSSPGQLGHHNRVGEWDEQSPSIVLDFLNRDGTIRQSAICEVTAIPTDDGGVDLAVYVPCPKCVARGVPSGAAQMLIRSSHRKWWLDERKAGPIVRDFGAGGQVMVNIAGTMTAQDRLRCKAFNCDFSFRIDDSKVIED